MCVGVDNSGTSLHWIDSKETRTARGQCRVKMVSFATSGKARTLKSLTFSFTLENGNKQQRLLNMNYTDCGSAGCSPQLEGLYRNRVHAM